MATAATEQEGTVRSPSAPPVTLSPCHLVTLSPAQWGVVSFLVSEVALFGTLIVTYVFYLGKDVVGPTPAEALSLSLALCTTACLLLSSGTVHMAEKALHRTDQGGFVRWWLATIVLGAL